MSTKTIVLLALTIVLIAAVILGAIDLEMIAVIAIVSLVMFLSFLAGRWVWYKLANIDPMDKQKLKTMTSLDKQIYFLSEIDRKMTTVDIVAKIWLTLFVISLACSLLTLVVILLGVSLVSEAIELIFMLLREMMRGVGL